MKRLIIATILMHFLIMVDAGFAQQQAEEILKAVVKVRAVIPDDALTAPFLGTEREGNSILIDSEDVVGVRVVQRGEFVGYWEYLLDNAIYTSPPYQNFAGAALIGPDGSLTGIGSIFTRIKDVTLNSIDRCRLFKRWHYFFMPGIGSPESRSATACLKPTSSARCLNHIPSGLCRAMPSKRVAMVWVLA
ncbi:MAG: hypothetical protein GY850_35830 [bacterium]|nr:hypothetical protein [bacterium]